MEAALVDAGYSVFNCNYPSRKYPVEQLYEDTIRPMIDHCMEQYQPDRLHFVTHSIGGILIRYYLSRHKLERPGRVVMLGPPNAGSELVDRLSSHWWFTLLNGPAGKQLGTEASSLPNSLGPVDYEVGIIAGKTTLGLLSPLIIPGEHDGKVSIRSARLDGMADFIILPYGHAFMMNRRQVIEQTILFLQRGKFDHERNSAVFK
jgi:pimeloyl-ACP methyl ester carboxylesterase